MAALFLTGLVGAGSLQAQSTFSLFFAQVAHGTFNSTPPSSFQTTLQLFNSSNQSVNATVTFRQDDGTAFNVGLQDGATGTPLTPTSPGVFSISIPARGLKVLITSGAQTLQTGWAQVDAASSALNGNAFFQQMDGGGNLISQVGVSNSPSLSSFTGFFEKSATVNTGVALANPSATVTAVVTMQVIDSAGMAGPSAQVTVGPLKHISRFVDQFDGLTGITSGIGTIAFSSNNNVVATTLRQDRAQFTSLPMFAGTSLVPNLTQITPSQGAPFTTVTISGTNFDATNPSNNKLKFNNVNAAILSVTASTIVATVPQMPGVPNNTVVSVTVTANGGTSNALNFTLFDGFPAPVITSFDPPSVLVGSAATKVTIHGKNFATTALGAFVQLNSNIKPALQVSDSATATMTLTADLLASVQTYSVVFVNPGNTLFGVNSSNTVQFQVANQVSTQAPTITGINPPSARINARVTITGTNFDPANTANNIVKFNGVAATQVFSSTGTQLQVNVPVGATTGPVTVTVNGLVSNGFAFTVLQTPPLRTVVVGTTPTRVAFDSATNTAVVTNVDSNSISFVDVANGILIKNLQTGGQNPVGVALFGRNAFVANFVPPNFPPTQRFVSVINLDTQSNSDSINVSGMGGSPFNLAIDSSTGTAVITDNSQHLGFLNITTRQTSQGFAATPYDVAIYNPSSTVDVAAVSDFSENKLLIFDVKTMAQMATVPVGGIPQGVAVNPSTGMAVVVNSGDNTASIVNLTSQTVVGTVPVGLRPNYVAIDSARNRAVVSNNGDGTISVIDLAAKTVIATLSTGGNNPTGVAISELGNLAIVANSNSGTVGLVALP